MRQAEIDIGPDLGQLLLGVGRHDPPARRPLDRQGVGQPLHLARVLDAHLLFRGQGERRPMPRVLHRPLRIGVERDLDLDHPFEITARPPRPLEALLDFRKQCLAIERIPFAARADEAVPDLAGHRRRSRARCGDPDRHRLLRAVINRRRQGAVILALERDAFLGPQLPDQGDRLAQPPLPFLEARPFHAGRRHFV